MKRIKISLLILILIFVVTSIPVVSIAGDSTHGEINTGDFKDGTSVTTTDAGELATKTADLLATIRNIGIIIAVVMIAIIGFKYILGSLEEKASYKENMLIYVVGCFLLMMATTIPSIVYNIIK